MSAKDFLGSGLKFPLRVDPKTGKLAMVHHEDDIVEAIGIIIGTNRGERVMRPEFGSTASDYLFEPADATISGSISHDIREQLILQEPRIVDVQVKCSEQSATAGVLKVSVDYTVRDTNNRYNRVYPFYLDHSETEL